MSRFVYLEKFSSTESMQGLNRLGGGTSVFSGSGGVATYDAGTATCTLDTLADGFAGLVTTFKGRTGNPHNLDSNKMYGPLVETAYQGTLNSIRIHCTGTAAKEIKIRIEDGSGGWLHSATEVLSGGIEIIDFVISSPLVGMNRVVVEAGYLSLLTVQAIELEITDHVFTNTYEQVSFDCFMGLLRLYNESTNRVCDTSAFDYDELNATALGGALAMMLYMGVERGWVSQVNAEGTGAALVTEMLSAPNINGWFAHFTKAGGVVANGSEYSTIDTAIGLVSADIAMRGLGCTAEAAAVAARIQALGYSDPNFIHPTLSRVSHGYANDGVTVLNYHWDQWGAESALIQILYWMQFPEEPAFNIVQDPPSWDGVGFTTEMTALWFRNFGVEDVLDHAGINWRIERQLLRAEQKAVTTNTLYGYSEAEVRISDSQTAYRAFGSGGDQGVPIILDTGGNGPWVTPSYPLMSASSDLASVLTDIQEPKFQSLTRIYGVAESAWVDTPTNTTVSVHWVLSSLRLFFCSVGAYHAALLSEEPVAADPIYLTAAAGVLGVTANTYAPVVGIAPPVGAFIAVDTSIQRIVEMTNSKQVIGNAWACSATLQTRKTNSSLRSIFNLITGNVTALNASLVYDATDEVLTTQASINATPADWTQGEVFVEFESATLNALNLRTGYYHVMWTATIDDEPYSWVGESFLAEFS